MWKTLNTEDEFSFYYSRLRGNNSSILILGVIVMQCKEARFRLHFIDAFCDDSAYFSLLLAIRYAISVAYLFYFYIPVSSIRIAWPKYKAVAMAYFRYHTFSGA